MKAFIFLLIIMSFLLRIVGINYGLPGAYHPDETRQILDSIGMAARHSIIPLEFTYPALHKYILLAGYSLYYIFGRIFGIFKDSQDFAFLFLTKRETFYLFGRLISVLFGMLTIWFVYKIGNQFFNRKIGLYALILSGFMFHLIGHSQWALPDSLLIFFVTASFYYIFKLKQDFNYANAILLGIFTGLAISTKYQAVFLLAPTFLLFIIKLKNNQMHLIETMAIFIVFLILFGLLGNLSWIFNFRETQQRFLELSEEKIGISSIAPYSYNIFSMLLWFVKEMLRQETTIGVLLLMGAIWALIKRTPYDYLYFAYFLLFLWGVSDWGVRYLHILVAIFPVMCVFAARFVSDLVESYIPKKKELFANFVFSLILLPSFFNTIQADFKKTRPDTRQLAKYWIEKNIPSGSSIAIDWYDFGPALLTVPPMYFQGKREAFYNSLPINLRKRYDEYVLKHQNYRLTQIIHSAEKTVFPSDMPPEVMAKAKDCYICNRLYSWFNFSSLKDLQKMDVEYVIISSFSYNHFLLDNDPYKLTGLFDPYLKEDTITNNRQVDFYDAKSKHGLLFYLAKRARGFYSPFLKNDKRAKLIANFNPENSHLSPLLKIYQVIKN